MDFVKNQIITIVIEDIGTNGEGIGKVDGFTFFVKGGVIGDQLKAKILKVKKHYGYARIEKIIVPGKDRITPVCPVADKCGGCTIQHLSYQKQLEWKFQKVKNCLERIGGLQQIEQKMEPIYGMEDPYYYRNKAQFPVGTDRNGRMITGFYAGRTHSIIENTHCYIQAEINERILETVLEYCCQNHISAYDEKTGKGILRHILTRVGFRTGEIMVCLIINGNKKNMTGIDRLVEELRKIDGMKSVTLNINREKTNRILGNKIVPVWGQTYITDFIGEIQYQISPLSFYQVNPKQTEVLYQKALEYACLTGKETVWDLYCGIGTISLFLARKAKKVYGVEIVPQAIEDAKQNAEINQLDNVEFFVGKAEEILPREYEKNGTYADVIVVDPPRKGCDAVLLDTMISMAPKRIVYVSCDPATLARDVKILNESGYQIKKVSVVDQFAHSTHVETVALLLKEKME